MPLPGYRVPTPVGPVPSTPGVAKKAENLSGRNKRCFSATVQLQRRPDHNRAAPEPCRHVSGRPGRRWQEAAGGRRHLTPPVCSEHPPAHRPLLRRASVPSRVQQAATRLLLSAAATAAPALVPALAGSTQLLRLCFHASRRGPPIRIGFWLGSATRLAYSDRSVTTGSTDRALRTGTAQAIIVNTP